MIKVLTFKSCFKIIINNGKRRPGDLVLNVQSFSINGLYHKGDTRVSYMLFDQVLVKWKCFTCVL